MMQVSHIVAAVGSVLRIFTGIMVAPLIVALLMEPYDTHILGPLRAPRNALVFLASALAGTLAWWPMQRFTRHVEREGIVEREAYLSVGIGWLVLVILAMIPFMLSGVITHWADAFFEAMSGLTATGATILTGQLEDIAPSIMFWRALLQYLGGMGIVVLSVALLARLTHGGALLVAAELSGVTMQRLQPRLRETAITLWKVYGVLSVACFIAYLLAMWLHAGLPFGAATFDAILHTFTTLSTAGFSNHSASIGFYDSWIVELVVIVFVLIAGTNFALLWHFGRGDRKQLWKNSEWRFFMFLFAGSTVLVTGLLWKAGAALVPSLREAAFTVASIGTSLGYVTVDYDQWPELGKFILILLMFTGASAGSTSGGIKVLRILILWKVLSRQIRKLKHPRAVIPLRIGRMVVQDHSVLNVMAFFFAFLTIWLIGAAFLIGTDPALNTFDGAVAAASAVGNTGPAMGVVGPTDHFGVLQPSSKVAMGLLMWIGRLEVFTALLIFVPNSWTRG